ncbi:bifunctional GNAT family N-acetyltransferase/ATP-binding protein [Frankia sp. Ag45/Mut15]|uniref:Bifunctional GNAT family N-acetyltransferase/ATP-binding protein n=1 Tax=Frankia umida TaxID=573489 RepID=A0ABT0JZ64_9ACTN|nr:bifunctional GNAT family N-acetyltransferase/ATP-binding protein [Frankia umida]MCK9876833.1 bifunctional GNAT family N-acetyltransferase/ATP-binding protein [Frankia umida]
MPIWHIRPYETVDYAATVRLLEEVRSTPGGPPINLTDTVLALRHEGPDAESPAVVAVAGEHIVGAAVGRKEGGQGRVLTVAIAPAWRHHGIGSGLLQSVENQLLHAGCRRITTLITPGQTDEEAFLHRGFAATGQVLYDKEIPLRPADVSTVERWGGALLSTSEWSNLAGMTEERALIEQRLLLPVRERELAEAYGVVIPTAMLLFGPPGTGKTSFARAVAARLEWPFVELLPSRLASGAAGLASELRSAIHDLMGVERVVVFIDEVDEIAQSRETRPENQSVVNELLKAIPAFRGVAGRLLICATNAVSALDPAFVRPGRFDLVLPVGPPDATGRRVLLAGLLERVANKEEIDLDAVVAATDLFTPADLSAVVQRSAAAAFHRAADSTRAALTSGSGLASLSLAGTSGADEAGKPDSDAAGPHGGTPATPTTPLRTEDLLEAARAARPTISLTELDRFRRDAQAFTRI